MCQSATTTPSGTMTCFRRRRDGNLGENLVFELKTSHLYLPFGKITHCEDGLVLVAAFRFCSDPNVSPADVVKASCFTMALKFPCQKTRGLYWVGSR